MKSSEILELVRAGYTKAEITAMEADQTPEVQQEENIEAEPVADVKEESAANQPAQPADDGIKDQMAMLIKAVEQMSNRIISNNINQTVTDGVPQRGVSDILAEVINPPRERKEK